MQETRFTSLITFLWGFVSGFGVLFIIIGFIILRNPKIFDHRQTRADRVVVIGEEEFPPSHARAVYEVAANWKLTSLNGDIIPFSSFRGKATFLHFWGTYCAPCIPELVSIQALYDSLKTESIQFVVVANQQPEIVSKFLKTTKYTLPFYTTDPAMPPDLSGEGFPSTYVINSQGTIVLKHAGAAKWAHPWFTSFLRGIK